MRLKRQAKEAWGTRKLAKLRLLGSLAALCACPAIAAPKEAPCLTRSEARALMDFALPEVLSGVTDKCVARLPATSFLATHGKQLAETYRKAAEPNWPAAKAVFMKIGGGHDDAKIFAAAPDDALKAMMAAGLGVGLASKVDANQCSEINDLTEALAPLPPSNLSSIIVNIVILADKDESGELKICQ